MSKFKQNNSRFAQDSTTNAPSNEADRLAYLVQNTEEQKKLLAKDTLGGIQQIDEILSQLSNMPKSFEEFGSSSNKDQIKDNLLKLENLIAFVQSKISEPIKPA